MDINALLNVSANGTTPRQAENTSGEGFRDTLETARAQAMPAGLAMRTATLNPRSGQTVPVPSALPLTLLAGDAATLLAPGVATTGQATPGDESEPPAAQAGDEDSPAAEGLTILAGAPAPTTSPASTVADAPPATPAASHGDTGTNPAALARQAGPREGEANGQPPTLAERPPSLSRSDTQQAPAAPVMAETQRAADRPGASAEPATPTAPTMQHVTTNSSSAPSPATTTTVTTLHTPVAASGWGQELGQQVVSLTRRGDQHMELHLNPRDLGPLSVSLKLDDHGAQAHFFSSHAPVRGAVEQAIPQLREALAEQGIALGEAMVGDQPQQQFNGQTGDGQANGAPAPALADTGDDATVTGAEPVRAAALPTSGVDLYA
ncbi:flagellar hook-length control protein FliK [Alloalcanivorax sp. C16-2]|uniref:flagellar hook-length control protein FliK n=1 Tax=Alloalcanivorax sp. C16-2 TaxID=3390052 RepID=UPI0039704C6E